MAAILTGLTVALALALAVLVAMSLLKKADKGSASLMVVPLALVPILILNFVNIKNIKAELKTRHSAGPVAAKEV